ncbi:MAG TPA: transcription-repair coupling factor [Longimicrobiales bacterium]|nr:transcription-repair coupling factor [Longimicrobiales bacterium]
MHPRLIEAFQTQPAFGSLTGSLPAAGGTLRIAGLAGSAGALAVSALADRLPQRIWVVLANSPAEAESVTADVQSILHDDAAVLYPQREALPYEIDQEHVELAGLRVEAIEAVLSGRSRILITTARAIQELTPLPTGLAELRVTLSVDQVIRPADLTARLLDLGFEQAPLVEAVGQFALRGGILDVFAFGSPEPVRIEFWGDAIESIRHFDILDQRSTEGRRSVDLLPVDFRSGTGGHVRRSLLDLLGRDAVLVETSEGATLAEFRRAWDHAVHLHEAESRRGTEPEPPDRLLLMPDAARERLAEFGIVAFTSVADATLRFDTRSAEPIDRDMDRLSGLLRAGAARGERTFILCDNDGQLERLEALLSDRGTLPPGTVLAIGAVSEGFVIEADTSAVRVLTDHEIFARARRLRRTRRFRGAVALESISQLRPGDFVVHIDHGIGRFRGLEQVVVGDERIEALTIEYAGNETLRVPVYRLDLIERWVAEHEDSKPPRMHRIGGRSWKTLRRKTEQVIEKMAAELLELYAARHLAERPAYPADGRWQKEMESSFLYEDTPDQRQATADVKRDMESRHPMDRLICGDVGYGKTEIAIRAAFKAAQDGRQVAVLAPTTILVDQHLHTFRQRLAGYPVTIESLSRFRTDAEQKDILAGLASGRTDIVVGTHRLIEPDVTFRNLGMLIVDEEQRFGVRQKERFKHMRHHIDVLTLTATPIPRTLHLSMAGLRDLSLLQTPPRDRMPIITHVLPWVDEVVEDAILRELDRGGQVFVVHNRVQSIGSVAERVRRLVPDVEIAVAHGQMPSAKLEAVMHEFLGGNARILVSTAIIENGLDVPTANTLIVDRADQFGLAQLYQIRGRVGRSHHRAYCYLIVAEGVNDEAERRLRILEHFTDLGSGYAVALKDLELRGAGNILGSEQSGLVHSVGLDTYTRLLEQTMKRMRQAPDAAEPAAPCDVSLDGAAYLPDDFVPDAAQKLHLYRRLSRIETIAQVEAMALEVRDRYGPPPPEADRLLRSAALRLAGTAAGVERLLVRGQSARMSFRPGVVPRIASLEKPLSDRQTELDVTRTNPLSLVLRARGSTSILDTAMAALERLAAPAARAA